MEKFILIKESAENDLIEKMNQHLNECITVEIEHINFEYGNNTCLLRCTYE